MVKLILVVSLLIGTLYGADFGQIDTEKAKLIKAMENQRTELENKIEDLKKRLEKATSTNTKLSKDLKFAINSFEFALKSHKRCQINYDKNMGVLREIASNQNWNRKSFDSNVKRYEEDFKSCLDSNGNIGKIAKNLENMIDEAKQHLNSEGLSIKMVKSEMDIYTKELDEFTKNYEKLFAEDKK